MNDDKNITLPGAISAITPQKNNASRYSVFVKDDFLLGVSEETMLKHQLKTGVEITPAFFKKLQRAEGRNKIKNYMLKLISRRQHGRKELQRKARRKDFPADGIEDVLYELEEKDFIDDKQFAEKYANDKSTLKKWGPRKITAHLQKKGVKRTTAESAAQKAFNEINMETRLRELILKRRKHFLRKPDYLKRKQKAVNYLLQKGYISADIFKCIDDILDELDESR